MALFDKSTPIATQEILPNDSGVIAGSPSKDVKFIARKLDVNTKRSRPGDVEEVTSSQRRPTRSAIGWNEAQIAARL